MKTRMLALLAGLAVAAALGIAGCSADRSATPAALPPTGGSGSLDLDAEYGGLTATDEPVAFGDPTLEAAVSAEADESAGDLLALDPQVAAQLAQAEEPGDPADPARPRATFLRIVWGQLGAPGDTLAAGDEGVERVDWSGQMQVDRGVVIVRRVLRFERPGDHLLPRPDRHTVAWVSRTGRGSDGLLVEILEPPLRPDSTGVTVTPNRLRFRTAPFAAEFAVADLAGLDSTTLVLPEGNAIHFTGFRPAICPRGFLAGFWRADSDSAGTFRGRWLGLPGRSEGFLRGGYGYDSAGRRVLVGKWIGLNGAFKGLLKGTWEPLAEPGRGRFDGQWANAAGTVEGQFHGEFLAAPEQPSGFFAGRWRVSCTDESGGTD